MLQEFNYLSGVISWNIFLEVSHPKCEDRINLKEHHVFSLGASTPN